MRIGINIIEALPSNGGTWIVINNLLNAIAQYDKHNEYVIYATMGNKNIMPQFEKYEIVICHCNNHNKFQRYLYINTILPFRIKSKKLDCMLWPFNTISFINFVPSLVIIHDLAPITYPEDFPSFFKRLFLQIALKMTINKAGVILAISKTTEKDIKAIKEIDNMKIMPNIIHDHFRILQKEKIEIFRAKYNLPEKFWLYVANYYPNKNHLRLIMAYNELKTKNQQSFPLFFRGSGLEDNKEISQLIQENDLAQSIRFIPTLEFSEIALLYNAATALIFPSLFEGAGLPVMEAMACGCPVVASDIPTTREFAPDALLFNPNSIESMADAMDCFQKNECAIKEIFVKNTEMYTAKFRGKHIISILFEAYSHIC
ncbi:glycosyl transferase family 1 [Spirochaetia bacterium]|nr:glycosyl transferase family 1 [Spirochaetia bacterium]